MNTTAPTSFDISSQISPIILIAFIGIAALGYLIIYTTWCNHSNNVIHSDDE